MTRTGESALDRASKDIDRARQAYASHLGYCKQPGKACVHCSGYIGQIGRAHDRLDVVGYPA